MESLRELNKICQKKDYKKVGNWMARNITRDMALPISWLLLHTPITANCVTVISLFIGLAGCMLFLIHSTWGFLGGVMLLQIWYLLDHVDGHIARYRKQSSVTGIFLDYYTHHIIHAGVYICLALGIFWDKQEVIYVLYGIITAFSVMFMNLIYDTQKKAYEAWIVINDRVKVSGAHAKVGEDRKHSWQILRQSFSYMHKSMEIHVLMNILTLAAILNLFIKEGEIFKWLLIFYACLIPIVVFFKLTYRILKKIPDKEFSAYAELFKEKIY